MREAIADGEIKAAEMITTRLAREINTMFLPLQNTVLSKAIGGSVANCTAMRQAQISFGIKNLNAKSNRTPVAGISNRRPAL
jgi:hypothetical protein